MKMDNWTSGADYDRWMGRWSRLLADEFLSWLSLPPKLRWLDVCCGSGVLSEAIVERFVPTRIVGVDVSLQQIEFARAHRAGPFVSFQVGDAMALPFEEGSFDAVVCGLGLNYLPDPKAALQGMQRIAAPEGIIAIYVWDYADGTRFLREFWDAATAVDPEAAAYDQAHRFALCNPESLRELFDSAGLKGVRAQALDIVTRFISFDDYWQPLLAGQGSAPNYLVSRDEATQVAIRERLRDALPACEAGVIELPARGWAVSGRRASAEAS